MGNLQQHFNCDSWELIGIRPRFLTPISEARQTLHEAAQRVKKFTDAAVTVSGHTDNVGNDASNQVLSDQRATAVKEYFLSRESVPAAGLAVKAYGKSQPVADNKAEEGRARNRRVDVVITPKGK